MVPRPEEPFTGGEQDAGFGAAPTDPPPPPRTPPFGARPTGGAASPYPPQNIGEPWSSSLFDCNLNSNNAVMTAFFPCVTFGQNAEILDQGGTSCILGSFMYILMVPALLTCWILGSNYRTKLRNQYNLVQAPSEDWAVHLFCPCCSLCQEFRELQHRGIDPSLGWMGYLAQQQGSAAAAPRSQFMNSYWRSLSEALEDNVPIRLILEFLYFCTWVILRLGYLSL